MKQVDDACKEIARNCELLVLAKSDLDSILRRVRCEPALVALQASACMRCGCAWQQF